MSGIFDLRMHVSGLRSSAFEPSAGSRTHSRPGHDSHGKSLYSLLQDQGHHLTNLAEGKRGTRAEKF